MRSDAPSRLPLIDALKALASQLVLLHHFMSYGPLANLAKELVPALQGWLYDYGRMAVQAFLVAGGYLAARALSPHGQGLQTSIAPLLARRYLRLALPFIVAICFAMLGSTLARLGMNDPAIPAPATLGQWFAHLTLMHGVLGHDALSTGVWYVAIDFQLFGLFALTLWIAKHPRIGGERTMALGSVILLGVLGLFVFNRDPDWDNWGVYFFGSYGLGILVFWLEKSQQRLRWLALMCLVVGLALLLEFRTRIALALAIALLLAWSRDRRPLPGTDHPVTAYLARVSYAVFLLHFPIYLMISALWLQMDWLTPYGLVSGMATAWLLSLLAADRFHALVEVPAARLDPIKTWQRWAGRRLGQPS